MKLLGFVDKGNERLIITEFVPNGTLREHLDGKIAKICYLTRLRMLTFFLFLSFFGQVSMEKPWILISGLR